MSLPHPGGQVPAGSGDAGTGRDAGGASAGGPRAGFALLLSLSMAQFMVVLDKTHTGANMTQPRRTGHGGAESQGFGLVVRDRTLGAGPRLLADDVGRVDNPSGGCL
jgi:hypothetical protein